MTHPLVGYLIATALLAIGGYGVAVRRSALLVLMAIEIMLAGVTLFFVTAAVAHGDNSGQVAALFIIVIAAAEFGLGLAVVLARYRQAGRVDLDDLDRELR